jgi:hypothetical protein
MLEAAKKNVESAAKNHFNLRIQSGLQQIQGWREILAGL